MFLHHTSEISRDGCSLGKNKEAATPAVSEWDEEEAAMVAAVDCSGFRRKRKQQQRHSSVKTCNNHDILSAFTLSLCFQKRREIIKDRYYTDT